jgi:hypothetical protein
MMLYEGSGIRSSGSSSFDVPAQPARIDIDIHLDGTCPHQCTHHRSQKQQDDEATRRLERTRVDMGAEGPGTDREIRAQIRR